MNIKQHFLLTFVILVITTSGCGYKSPHNYYPEEKITQYSEIGVERDVLVGDNIIHYQAIKNTEVLDVMQNLTSGSCIIPLGEYEKTGEDENNIYFNETSVKGRRVTTGLGPATTGLVYFKNKNKITIMLSGDYLLWSWDSGFKIKTTKLKQVGEDFNMRSLNYGGSHANLVSFEYKEGRNTQRITHNMNKGSIFKYQGAEVEIIKHSPSILTCKVIKEFDIFK